MNKQEIIFRDLGRMEYQTAWDYQEQLLRENLEKKRLNSDKRLAPVKFPDGGLTEIPGSGLFESTQNPIVHNNQLTRHYLLFVEHPPVYTLGKSGKEEHILIDEKSRIEKGIAYIKTNRGGDITFHGPEQLVGYPILDLEKFYTDIGKYLRSLEEVIILTMAEYGLKGERSPGETGVWIDSTIKGQERKICAMGVRCSRWITMHGFAFNVNTSLHYFDYIIPCGIAHKKVTSLEKELGRKISMEEVKLKVKRNFSLVFDTVFIEGVSPFLPGIL